MLPSELSLDNINFLYNNPSKINYFDEEWENNQGKIKNFKFKQHVETNKIRDLVIDILLR